MGSPIPFCVKPRTDAPFLSDAALFLIPDLSSAFIRDPWGKAQEMRGVRSPLSLPAQILYNFIDTFYALAKEETS